MPEKANSPSDPGCNMGCHPKAQPGTCCRTSRSKHEMRYRTMNKSLALFALGVSMSAAVSAHAANPAMEQQFQRVSDEYFDKLYFPNQPTVGTLSGYHQYDTQLEDYSRKKIDAWVADLVFFERRIETIPAAALDEATRGDREMVL